MDVINLKQAAAAIPDLYRYVTIAKMNGHTFSVVRVKDRTLDFHSHQDSDEVFFIIDGEMKLEFRNKVVTLKAGEMCVVPKGVEHRPVCTTEVHGMLIEKEDTLTPANTGGSLKKA